MHITKEINNRLTRVGRGTAMGEALRRYWVPVCLSQELVGPPHNPVPVRVLGEDLVVFRGQQGTVGALSALCAHRCAPLAFGWNESDGLRCANHGWKFDIDGNCIEIPGGTTTDVDEQRVAIRAYPARESGSVVWIYMGERELQPEMPDFEWMRAPNPAHMRISKTGEHCNWLQALEGGIDTAHSSFLHRNDLAATHELRNLDTHPRLEIELQDWGYTYASIRTVGEDTTYLRLYQFILPFHQLRAVITGFDGSRREKPSILGHMWVPIDDDNTWVYNFTYADDTTVSFSDDHWEREESRNGRGRGDYIPGTHWLRANASNDYYIDRGVQKSKTFTGIPGVNTQDYAIQEGMQPIVDRSRESLGSSDQAVQTARRLLLQACDDAEHRRQLRGLNPTTSRDIRAYDLLIPIGMDWRDVAKEVLVAKW